MYDAQNKLDYIEKGAGLGLISKLEQIKLFYNLTDDNEAQAILDKLNIEEDINMKKMEVLHNQQPEVDPSIEEGNN